MIGRLCQTRNMAFDFLRTMLLFLEDLDLDLDSLSHESVSKFKIYYQKENTSK